MEIVGKPVCHDKMMSFVDVFIRAFDILTASVGKHKW